MRLRSLQIQAAITLLLPLVFYGCFFDLSEKEDFPSWYYGDPGLAGALGETDCDRYADNIEERRHPYYLHFRTPEVFLQPQGGAHYPKRTTAERRASRKDATPPACEKVGRGWETFRFDAVDAGVVDMVVPYRKPFADSDYRTQPARRNLAYAQGVVYNTGLAAVMKAPVYIVHDILKTLYIPVAGVYYLLQPDQASESTGERVASSQDTGGSAVRETMPPPLPADETMDDSEVAADEDATLSVEAEEEEESAAMPEAATPEAATNEGHAVAPSGADEPDPADDKAVVPATGEAAADTTLPEDRPADTMSPDAASLSSGADASAPETPMPANTASSDDMRGEGLEGPEATKDAAGPAAGTAPATAAGPESPPDFPMDQEGTDSEASDWPMMPQETGDSAVENRPAAVPKAPSDGVAEEDRLSPAPAAGEIYDDAPDPAGDIPRRPANASPTAVVSVSPAREAVSSETPPALEPIPWVRLAKGKLRKRVAFLGFYSRAANVDEETKAYLQERLWPVFEEQCEDALKLVRPGDADFPTALNALMRGPYGHLNSFELTTVSRFNGLNAIVSGTIIDIRVSKQLGGILWYKSPEGQLRITILVEVYDAETGTKLLDRLYIREEEVEELEPGAGEKPRNEDQAVLAKTLQSIAEDMGEDVCEVLEDQPWRFFVAGIDGTRITLSAGENAGLKVGNVLRVHNSQIIDGMNNQQFFLTGEKVGRIQIINLFANHSEALLIEGQGLRDYSVVIPE